MWELCRLSDGKWSVRKDGVEKYIFGAVGGYYDRRAADEVAKMLNALQKDGELR